jgi:hypothetical protein
MRCDVGALDDWRPTFQDSAMVSWVGLSMQCFGTFRPLNSERTTLPHNVGDHTPGNKTPHATRTETSRWKCDGSAFIFVRFYHKRKRTTISEGTFVAVLFSVFLNLCIYALIDLYRINGYNNGTTFFRK